ncbi:MFS transporter [Maritimibacter sp. UBA3975]|uniref:MFS transporter n=1 Tax=Maritimibacter sp. UBA3975 TaxID=1946833 RepID=UPI000C090552|nr:MFS transporter [Maritimibacter sp. UBA3975]MAM61916.1 MFS transporter [Maritimibacter sp.]|tara:strand:- start:45101 stop:46336 length:1236 start_codon:yes stop_codon:yes gene_type:complete
MSQPRLFTPVLIAGCLVLMVSFAIRASFGVFQIPIASEFGWPRAEFSFAIAMQNLAWGIGQPIFGAIAEKVGDRKAIILGALLYAAGLVGSSFAVTPGAHDALEFVIGFGVAGTGFGVILAVVGRAASDAQRSLALAVATAVGSSGQIFGPPVAEWLLGFMPWQNVFLIFAVAILAVLAVLPLMRAPVANRQEIVESLGTVLTRAMRDPSFALIFLGFFSCGYQLGFMTAHFPAFVTEMCGAIDPGGLLASVGVTTTSALGALAMALVGAANVAGTLFAGWLGGRVQKKYVLVGIYTLRTVFAAVFIMLPITPLSVVVFSITMGSLWLATVPLTSGLVAHLYGLRYMGTLYGIVFFSHQLGSFLGVWLGGRFYDLTGDYTMVWWVGVGVGALSALLHLPIRERRAPVLMPA